MDNSATRSRNHIDLRVIMPLGLPGLWSRRVACEDVVVIASCLHHKASITANPGPSQRRASEPGKKDRPKWRNHGELGPAKPGKNCGLCCRRYREACKTYIGGPQLRQRLPALSTIL